MKTWWGLQAEVDRTRAARDAYERRRETKCIRRSLSRAGRAFAIATDNTGPLFLAAGAFFSLLAMQMLTNSDVAAIVVGSTIAVAGLTAAMVLFVAATRAVEAERRWLASLPFAVNNYDAIVGAEPERLRGGASLWIGFEPSVPRETVLHLFQHDKVPWTYEAVADMYVRGMFIEAEAPHRFDWGEDNAVVARGLHALLERLRALHAAHPFTTLHLFDRNSA